MELLKSPCLRGKFSSVHEDLMAEGISRAGQRCCVQTCPYNNFAKQLCFASFPKLSAECNKDLVNQVTGLEELDEEMLVRAIAMSLEEKEGEVAQEELGSIKING